ncbi:chemotaxis protein CheW [Rhodovarius crocodyli]|uniref:Chemotaxis protein CheW n=1 Tax=Rhodovarius crocodyli TaxID=1979269 RepID=A0A437MNM8_9PROT|nr:chemotaxis protein CheW [Rhodovarius crocodyli]RVT99239.1 chemotaxis protein CheW [Rhodovarius crocodyli]
MAESTCLLRPPLLRRLPGGGLMGFHASQAWPVIDPEGVAERPGTRWHFDGETLLAEPGPERPQHERARRDLLPSLPLAPARRVREGTTPGMRLLRQGASALVIPRARLRRIVPMPELRPLPFAPAGVAGLAAVPGGAALVLTAPAEQPLLALVELDGGLFGLPVTDAAPDADEGSLDSIPEEARPLAPRARQPALTPPQPSQPLLLWRVGAERFALPALEVEAVLPPQPLARTPGGETVHAAVAHRGQVLPVLDAGEALSLPPVLGQAELPLLRLMGPVAVAVSAIEGLRQVREADITPGTGAPILASAFVDGAPVPVLSPAWLARGA